MEKITKRFPGVLALNKVDFDLERNEVHALVGENGAGKSTLIKILAGVLKPDEGRIILNDKEVKFHSVEDAFKKGISVIHQELNLAENLTVAENIFLGQEPFKGFRISKKLLFKKAQELLEKFGFNLDPKIPVEKLNVSEKQIVAIAKALSRNAKIIIMDEPTATLTEHEVEQLFQIIKRLKKSGISVIFISHRLDEIFEIADRVTVLRDGNKIGTGYVDKLNKEEIIKMMIGREISEMYPKNNEVSKDVIFEVRNLSVENYVRNISFYLKKGEIFGIAGLVGCGKSELALGLFGVLKSTFDKLVIFGKEIPNISDPLKAMEEGIIMIPEDRKTLGLILELDILKNLILPNTEYVSGFSKINWRKAAKIANEYMKRLQIKAPSIKQLVKNLSGGNQQKVVIAKYLLKKPKIAIFVEPTRGIDVGSKVEIYNLINKLANEGTGIIFISSELPEIVNLCDRVLVMHRGEMTALLEKEEITQENIMKAATGVEIV